MYIKDFGKLDELLIKALTGDIKKYAPGIEIVTVRVTKPRIPEALRRNYEEMEVKRTTQFIKDEERKVVVKRAETDQLRATIEAQKLADISAIQMKMARETKMAAQKIAAIEDAMLLARERGQADAKLYTERKMSEANKKMLTPAYVQYEAMRSIKNNAKTYFVKSGEKLLSFWDA